MSSDNGVYILQTFTNKLRNGNAITVSPKRFPVYRIAHTQAIENLEFYRFNQVENLGAYMLDVWGKSQVYTDEGYARRRASQIATDIMRKEPLEYGVMLIETEYTFYRD